MLFSAIRRRLHLTPSTVIASLALVFAMSGGAYAASKYVITSTKQISPKVLKSLTGKAGPAGAKGAAGVNGAQGPVGAAGAQGAAGPQGAAGAAGAAGGQGIQGVEGKAGKSTIGFTKVLPPEETETGVWALTEVTKAGEPGRVKVPISFNIPLEAGLGEKNVKVIESGEGTVGEGCGGGTVEHPTAEPGFLCVYMTFGREIEAADLHPTSLENGEEGAGTTGTILNVAKAPEGAYAYGTWAVTAPEQK